MAIPRGQSGKEISSTQNHHTVLSVSTISESAALSRMSTNNPLVDEFVVQVLPYPMTEAHILRNSIETLGLLIVGYSLYGARD